MLVAGQTSPMFCHYLPGDEAGTKLYCLAHVCEQLAQGSYLALHQVGVEPVTSRSLIRHAKLLSHIIIISIITTRKPATMRALSATL